MQVQNMHAVRFAIAKPISLFLNAVKNACISHLARTCTRAISKMLDFRFWPLTYIYIRNKRFVANILNQNGGKYCQFFPFSALFHGPFRARRRPPSDRARVLLYSGRIVSSLLRSRNCGLAFQDQCHDSKSQGIISEGKITFIKQYILKLYIAYSVSWMLKCIVSHILKIIPLKILNNPNH